MTVVNPAHPRVRRALLRPRRPLITVGCALGLLAFTSLGIFLLVSGNSLGWLIFGLASPFFILGNWVTTELKNIPAGPTETWNDLLSADAIAILHKYHTLQSAAPHLLADTMSGRFLMTRFGLFPDLIETIANQLPSDFSPILQKALELRSITNSSQINGAVVLVAIIASHPDYENLLRAFQLEPADLLAGITWYNYLHNRMKAAGKRTSYGGLARDLNFGYIPTLQHFGHNLSDHLSSSARSQIERTARKEQLDKMLQIFSAGGSQNVALIGPEGTGKSILVNAFAACLLDETMNLPAHLKYRQVFKLDASALISGAGSARGSIENLLNKLFNEAYAAKNIILYLNNAQLFFQDATGAVDLTNLLQPIIEAGRLRIIFSIEEQDFLRLSASNKGLANSLNRIFVQPTDEKDTMSVMEDQVPYFEHRFHVVYDYRSLKEAYRLGSRYVADRAMPGRALRLLELGAQYPEGNLITPKSIQIAVEKNLGVKVQVAETTNDRNKLLDLETLIHQRMVDQAPAVKTVSSALRRAAAGVRNEKRPIGTFLFLGPTGVGKTELAKAVSEVYFNGEKQIVRLDLNEFVTEDSVNRLIADAATDPMSLTAQIVKRPFSVVLLDEIEKAHPSVLTTLLQMLDEGILRDINNKEVSFRDAIIIATSNAGANRIREHIANHTPLEQIKADLLNELIKSGEFKPEFINRFDEVCIFEPLSRDSLFKIIDLILNGVNQTLAPQKISVRLDDQAKALLVERGYDPELGARPLRRIVQQSVENLVAKAILMGIARPGAVLDFSAEDIKSELGIR